MIWVYEQGIGGIVHSYGQRKVGELVAVVDSEYYIEVAVVNGSAQKKLDAEIGDTVEFIYKGKG